MSLSLSLLDKHSKWLTAVLLCGKTRPAASKQQESWKSRIAKDRLDSNESNWNNQEPRRATKKKPKPISLFHFFSPGGMKTAQDQSFTFDCGIGFSKKNLFLLFLLVIKSKTSNFKTHKKQTNKNEVPKTMYITKTITTLLTTALLVTPPTAVLSEKSKPKQGVFLLSNQPENEV